MPTSFWEIYFRRVYSCVESAWKYWSAVYSVLLSKHLTHPKTINRLRALDAGCGYGYVAELLEGRGYDAIGIDISDYAIKIAKKHSSAEFVVVSLEHFPFQSDGHDWQ